MALSLAPLVAAQIAAGLPCAGPANENAGFPVDLLAYAVTVAVARLQPRRRSVWRGAAFGLVEVSL